MNMAREPVIQVKNLYKIFRVGNSKVRALNGVDLTIYRGEFCAIVGTSGSGKSTMLNMLAGLEKPTKGEVVVAGEHLEHMTENQLVRFRREKVGFIFQSFNLLGTMNAVENVALPLTFRGVDKKVREEKASRMLDMVGLSKHKKHRPNEMSGGQQQRLCIARALAVEPEVLLMDEPTSALDPISTSKIEDLAMELKKDYTIVMVTHNMQQAVRVSDNTAFFLLGEVVEYNDTEKLFSIPSDKRTEDYITGRFG